MLSRKGLCRLCNAVKFCVRAKSTSIDMELADHRFFLPMPTRLNDNDAYGHVNNSVYFFYADTIINNYLIWHCGYDAEGYKPKRFMVHSAFDYRFPVEYPQILLGGLGVKKIGRSSVTYICSVFAPKDDYSCSLEPKNNDVFSKLGIGLQGVVIDDDAALKNIEEHFYSKPCATGNPVHVFVDANDKPLTKLPENLSNGYLRIKHLAPSL